MPRTDGTSHDYNSVAESDRLVAALVATQGIDPILAVVDEASEQIPQQGYLIDAKVSLGSFNLNIYRYPEGGLTIIVDADTRESYGEVSAFVGVADYGQLSLSYNSYASGPVQRISDEDRKEGKAEYALRDEGLLVVSDTPSDVQNNDEMYTDMRSLDIARFVREVCDGIHTPVLHEELPITRVTDDPGQVLAIIGELASASGMSDQDVAGLLGIAAPSHVIGQ